MFQSIDSIPLAWILVVQYGFLYDYMSFKVNDEFCQISTETYFHDFILYFRCPKMFRGCLVYVFKQSFLVFKQHFTHFHTFFHPHVFP